MTSEQSNVCPDCAGEGYNSCSVDSDRFLCKTCHGAGKVFVAMNNEKQANELDRVADIIRHYAKVLRGEEQDLTGIGYERLTCDAFCLVMGKKLLTKEQYEEYLRLSDEDFKRRGGRTSY